jgi:6-pyruvoyltetrahydropterin/6-carboxytetrahydropterin synthase
MIRAALPEGLLNGWGYRTDSFPGISQERAVLMGTSQIPAGSFTIGRQFSFEAAHHLPSLGPAHKCFRPHGHGYRVEVILCAGTLSPPGFVTDFGDLVPVGRYLADELDHRDLNQAFPFEPTSEHLALHLAGWIIEHVEPHIPGRLAAVRISETATCWAQFTVGRH